MDYYIFMDQKITQLSVISGQLDQQRLATRLLVISHYIERNSLDRLSLTGEFPKLNLSYVGYLLYLAQRDHTLVELAGKLSISKQACGKALKELEKLGFISRYKNPNDSRSSFITPSALGRKLLNSGIAVTNDIHQRFAQVVGFEQLQQLSVVLEKLCLRLGIDMAPLNNVLSTLENDPVQSPAMTNRALAKLNEYIRNRAKNDLQERGFSGLKSSFGPVLGMINREGRHIQYMAKIMGVSKQSVAAIASELESLGYVARTVDPGDKRQVVLQLTEIGKALILKSDEVIAQIEKDFKSILTAKEYTLMDSVLSQLYASVAVHFDTANLLREKINHLAQLAIDELGVTGANALAQHLLSITRGRD